MINQCVQQGLSGMLPIKNLIQKRKPAVSCYCQRIYCRERGSVMRRAASRPPSNKDCTIKGKQLYNVQLDMEGCPSPENMQCLRVCAIVLQF